MTLTFRILTLNIHKGFSHLNTRFVLHELREAIRETHADVVFLQEVQGVHALKAERHANWPDQAQYEFLADTIWKDFAYGKNAVYEMGHHGNAILSKFRILRDRKVDISTNPIEQRGMLWCEIALTDEQSLHCFCVHLGLTAIARRKQLGMIADYVQHTVPPDTPYIIAGDFNDWSGFPSARFAETLSLKEVHAALYGVPARTFPARRPLLPLDKIFVSGMKPVHSRIYSKGVWSDLSDHAALVADVRLNGTI